MSKRIIVVVPASKKVEEMNCASKVEAQFSSLNNVPQCQRTENKFDELLAF